MEKAATPERSVTWPTPQRSPAPRTAATWTHPAMDARQKIRAMLELRADVNLPDPRGWTLLHSLARAGDAANLQTAIDMKASIDARTADGRSAAEIAQASGNSACVGLLIEAQANSRSSASLWGAKTERPSVLHNHATQDNSRNQLRRRRQGRRSSQGDAGGPRAL